MKLTLESRGGLLSNKNVIVAEHGGQKVLWDSGIADMKPRSSGDYDIFAEVNHCWSRLPEQEQAATFEIYERAKNIFDNCIDFNMLVSSIKSIMDEMVNLHHYEKTLHYVEYYSKMLIPQTVKDVLGERASAERTYMTREYKELLTLTLIVRMLVPIASEFIARTAKTVGVTYKEFAVTRLIANTALANTAAWDKLARFIVLSLPQDKKTNSSVIDGVCDEDFPFWVLSLVIIRRLTVGDMRGVDPRTSLVTFIYKFIEQKVNGSDNAFAGLIKDKQIDGQGSDNEKNISKLESYKVKERISIGDIVVAAFHVADPVTVARQVYYRTKTQTVREYMRLAALREDVPIHPAQIRLIQIALSPVVSNRAISQTMDKHSVLNAKAAAAAVYWSSGFAALARVVASTAAESSSYDIEVGVKPKIEGALLETLSALFPYNKHDPRPRRSTQPMIVQSIETIDSQLDGCAWYDGKQIFATPLTVKMDLANFIVAKHTQWN